MARLTWLAYVDSRKLENSCLKISHYCCINIQTFRAVWLLHNLTLDGKLCLCDDKNAAFVYLHHLLPWEASLENVMMRISRKPFPIG